MDPFFDFVINCLEFDNILLKIYKKDDKIIAECQGKKQEFSDLTVKEILESWVKHEALTDNFTILKLDRNRIIEIKGNRILNRLPNVSFKKLKYNTLVLQV